MSACAKSGSSGANEARPSGRSGKTSPTLNTATRPSLGMLSAPASEREERRLVVALEVDVEAQHAALLALRNEPVAILLGDGLEHGVGGVRRLLVGEVD